jgi:ribonuclease PH
MMRKDGRSSLQLRPLKITPHFSKHAEGSVLIEAGDTRVLCTVCIEDGVPGWMRSSRSSRGWLTAEYSMLPSATHTRNRRERGHTSGRSQEIQRLIGRSLRGILDLKRCPDLTFVVDCDVIQADGGTRTAAITGSCVALKLAIDKLLRQGRLKQNPMIESVAAISIGFKNDEMLVDIDYEEDFDADLDMNIVLTSSEKILELQGTGERASFDREQVVRAIDCAQEVLKAAFELQQIAGDGQVAEG